jgi:hypothetical protein
MRLVESATALETAGVKVGEVRRESGLGSSSLSSGCAGSIHVGASGAEAKQKNRIRSAHRRLCPTRSEQGWVGGGCGTIAAMTVAPARLTTRPFHDFLESWKEDAR